MLVNLRDRIRPENKEYLDKIIFVRKCLLWNKIWNDVHNKVFTIDTKASATALLQSPEYKNSYFLRSLSEGKLSFPDPGAVIEMALFFKGLDDKIAKKAKGGQL